MGILAFIVDKLASLIQLLYNALPTFQPSFWDKIPVSSSITTLQKCINVANVIFPMEDVGIVIGLLFAYAIAMFSFWAMQRLLNLIRGSG